MVNALMAELEAERARYERLVERLAALQREGFRAPANTGPVVELAPDLPVAVAQALDAVDPGGHDRETRRWALRQVEAGMDEADLVAAIRAGSTAEWDVYA